MAYWMNSSDFVIEVQSSQEAAMEDVTLSHAKQHLEELIARAARGEEITISDPVLGTVILKTAVKAQR